MIGLWPVFASCSSVRVFILNPLIFIFMQKFKWIWKGLNLNHKIEPRSNKHRRQRKLHFSLNADHFEESNANVCNKWSWRRLDCLELLLLATVDECLLHLWADLVNPTGVMYWQQPHRVRQQANQGLLHKVWVAFGHNKGNDIQQSVQFSTDFNWY